MTSQCVIIMTGFRQPEMAALPLDVLNSPRLRVRRIHRTIELSPPDNRSGAIPFTNPSVPPDWTGNEWYRLLALEDPRRVHDLIIESAHKLE